MMGESKGYLTTEQLLQPIYNKTLKCQCNFSNTTYFYVLIFM